MLVSSAFQHKARNLAHFLVISIGGGTGAGSLASCANVEPVAPYAGPTTDPSQLYARLAFDQPAVTLSTVAPYDTIQLTAIPRNARDEPMDLPVPTYSSSDITKAIVDSNGFVTARGGGSDISIIASLKVGPVTHVDTAVIDITESASPPVLASVSIHPVSPDSAKWALNIGYSVAGSNGPSNYIVTSPTRIMPFYRYVTTRWLGTDGVPLADLQTDYTSLNPTVVTLDRHTGYVTIHGVGRAKLVATLTAYGDVRADTAIFTVTPPINHDVQLVPTTDGSAFFPTEVRIAPYGLVFWTNRLNAPQELIFDDPTTLTIEPSAVCNFLANFPDVIADHCGTGNPVLPGNPYIYPPSEDYPIFDVIVVRQFSTPGTYEYRTPGGAIGRVVVEAPIDETVN